MEHIHLLVLETVIAKFQGAIVFCDRANDVIWHAIRNVNGDFERDFSLRADASSQMLDHFAAPIRSVRWSSQETVIGAAGIDIETGQVPSIVTKGEPRWAKAGCP